MDNEIQNNEQQIPGVSTVISHAFRIYGDNFLQFVAIVAACWIPISLVRIGIMLFLFNGNSGLLSAVTLQSNSVELLSPIVVIGIIVDIFISPIGYLILFGFGMPAVGTHIAYSDINIKLPTVKAFKLPSQQSKKIIISLLFAEILLLVLLIWTLIPCVGWISGPGILLFYLGAFLPLIAPVIVFENRGIFQSLRRTWSLIHEHFWWTFGLGIALFILRILIIALPLAVVDILLWNKISTTANTTVLLTGYVILIAVITLILTLLYFPLSLSSYSIGYFALRDKDIRLQVTDELDLEQGDLLDKAHKTSADLVSQHLITINDVASFVFISITVIASYYVFMLFFGDIFGGIN